MCSYASSMLLFSTIINNVKIHFSLYRLLGMEDRPRMCVCVCVLGAGDIGGRAEGMGSILMGFFVKRERACEGGWVFVCACVFAMMGYGRKGTIHKVRTLSCLLRKISLVHSIVNTSFPN